MAAAAPDLRRVHTVAIAPRSEALTFARWIADGRTRLMLVSSHEDGTVRGVECPASDPIELFAAQGYEALAALAGPDVSIVLEQLALPFDGSASQIAAGVNYPEHGEEVSVKDSFLFPKQTLATRWNAPVPARQALLDYELELGYVALADLRRGEKPQYLGLVLASDYTDRADLVRHIKLTHVHSGEGFTQAKSPAGYMPLGALLVIPRDYDSYAGSLKMHLWHNGEHRQLAEPPQMIWDIHRIFAETFALEGRAWLAHGKPERLPVAQGVIPARTVVLSGTPGGVIYQPPKPLELLAGAAQMLLSLRWDNLNRIVEPSLRKAYASGRFLKPGDEVVMHADGLGLMRNAISTQ